MQGIVIKTTGSWYYVLTPEGSIIDCKIKGNFRLKGIKTTNPVAVGDHVFFKKEANEAHGVIYQIEERRNCIIRKSVNLSKQSHILAANIDEAFLVVSLCQPRTPQGFMDRFLLTAEAYHVPASIIFNKVDIYDVEEHALLDEYLKMYQSLGYTCYVCSALEKKGLEPIREAMQGNVNLFSGNSGVGKSALINALDAELNIKTGEVSSYHNKGKHTTTFAEMHPLSFGGHIMDTPGIREFGMVDFNTEEVSLYFPEMHSLKADCQFNNCTHVHEPNCAVKFAMQEKRIHPWRYKSYLAILNGEEVDTPGLLENKQDEKK